MKVGDMIYIPSETYVHQYPDLTQRYERLKEPQSLLVIGESPSFYEVLMFGSSWHVKKRDVYEIKKEVKGDYKIS
jgi:hypothetical protein